MRRETGNALKKGAVLAVFAFSVSSCGHAPDVVPNDSPLREFEVRGTSMSGILQPGTTVRTVTRKPKKGDVAVLENPKANDEYLVKRILGTEGDSFEYKNGEIRVNGEILKTAAGEKYEIGSDMLRLYAKDYPVIPKNAVFVLGNEVRGSYDSSEFGFVDESSVIGIVEN